MTTFAATPGTVGLIELLLVIGVPLVVVLVVRIALPGERLVVVRRERIVRVPRHRITMIWPTTEQVRRWPVASVEIAALARGRTLDGVDVRAGVVCEVEIDAPVDGAVFIDPVVAVRDLLEAALGGAIEAREVGDLVDPARGLATALAALDLPAGRLLTVELAEVDALLGPPGMCSF